MSTLRHTSHQSHCRPGMRGFTLIEMLLVITIIGILTALALPALKGMTKAHKMSAAVRQMLDDVGLARQMAINNRTRVYMVFIPPNFWQYPANNGSSFNALQNDSASAAVRLSLGQYTTYALYADHSIGDQPGQLSQRYLTKWKTLPEGVMIETNKFMRFINAPIGIDPEIVTDPPFIVNKHVFNVYAFTNDMQFPFPPNEVTNAPPSIIHRFNLPYIAFDSQGRLISGRDEYIPLAEGSIFYSRDNTSNLNAVAGPADVIEPNYREPNQTNYNLIHIDWLTGRAKAEKIQLQ